MGYLGDRALNIGDTKWGETSYLLLTRFAYVDIFGQVIGVDRGTREPVAMRQWKEALCPCVPTAVFLPGQSRAFRQRRVHPPRALRSTGSGAPRHIDQRRLHGGELRRSRFPRHVGGHLRLRPAARDGCPIFHDANASLDAQGGHRHGARLQRRRRRDGNGAAEAPGRDGDVFPGVVPCRQIRLAGRHALTRASAPASPKIVRATRADPDTYSASKSFLPPLVRRLYDLDGSYSESNDPDL